MPSWSFPQTFSGNNKYTLTLNITEQSTDIGANTSTLAYSLVMSTAQNSYVAYSNFRTQISCAINGTTVFTYDASRNFNYPDIKASYTETLCSGTTTVIHNTDGTKPNCAVAASVTVAPGDVSPGSASISDTIALTVIPRASTCSWSGDFTIGSAKTITITRANASFNHKLKFTVGSASQTLPTGGTYAATSYSWTPASGTYASQFPTQTSRTGTLVLYTYNSGTLIGSNSYTFTLKIPDSWKPSVSVSLSPSSSDPFITSTGLYVAGYSAIQASITGTAATGAAIASYTISGAFSKTVNTSSASTVQTSNVLATSGSKSVTVTVADARGRTGSATASCSFTAYAYPAVSSMSYARGTYAGGVWTSSDTGEDLRITFTGACSLSGNGNTMSWALGAPVGTSGSGLTNGQTITQYATGIGSVTAYTVSVTLADAVGNSTTRSVYVPTIEMPFVIDPVLPALGVGAVPQNARTLELASNWLINVGAGITLPYTNDILASATAQAGGTVRAYRGSGASYTGTVPNAYFGYGTFLVLSRASTSINVIALSSRPDDGFAINQYNGSWQGWVEINNRYVDKVQAVTFSAGTIGTRANSYSWTSADIGGTPLHMQVVNSTGLANFMPICTIASSNAYLNIYRSTSSAYSSGSITVRIWY